MCVCMYVCMCMCTVVMAYITKHQCLHFVSVAATTDVQHFEFRASMWWIDRLVRERRGTLVASMATSHWWLASDCAVPLESIVSILALKLLNLDDQLGGFGSVLRFGTPACLDQSRNRWWTCWWNRASAALGCLDNDLEVVHQLVELRVWPLVLAVQHSHNHLPHHDTDRVHIGLGREWLVEVDLGCAVRVGSTQLAKSSLLVRVGIQARQAKVGNLQVPVFIQLEYQTVISHALSRGWLVVGWLSDIPKDCGSSNHCTTLRNTSKNQERLGRNPRYVHAL
jgi:hypothetical protein